MLELHKLSCNLTQRDIDLVVDHDWVGPETTSILDICACAEAQSGGCHRIGCVFMSSRGPGAPESLCGDPIPLRLRNVPGGTEFPFDEHQFKQKLGITTLELSLETEGEEERK